MRISDWSSDVCSSDLGREVLDQQHAAALRKIALDLGVAAEALRLLAHVEHRQAEPFGDPRREGDAGGLATGDRKSVGSGKSVSVSVDLGGRRIIKKKNIHKET